MTAPPDARAILLVEWRLSDDGATRSSLRLVARWQGAGARVRLFVLSRAGTSAPIPPGVTPVYPTAHVRRLRQVIAPAAVRLLASARTAGVVASGREIGFGLLASRLVAGVIRRPFVVIVRSEPLAAVTSYIPPRWQAANRRALRRADAVICISDGLAAAAEAAGVQPDAVRIVLNGVEIDHVMSARSRRPSRTIPGDGPLVVGVGRLEHQKGFDVLVHAHARVVAGGRPHRLLLLGEGRDREALSRLVDELGVADSVHMPGFEADPLPYIATADLFCLPSRWEGFGQSLAEAILLGTPVIAADCVSGPRQLLAGGAHGDLVPVDDVDALAVAMQRHLDAPERLREMAARGQAWGQVHLDVDRTAREMLEILQTVERVKGDRVGRARRSVTSLRPRISHR